MKELVEKRCRRSIAIVLTAKEREADPYLDAGAQARLRKVIMDQFNDFAAMAIDVIESLESGSIPNELWFEKMEILQNDLTYIKTQFGSSSED